MDILYGRKLVSLFDTIVPESSSNIANHNIEVELGKWCWQVPTGPHLKSYQKYRNRTHQRCRHQTKFIVPHTSNSSQQGQVYSAPQQTFLILILNNFVICLTVTASGRMCSSQGTQPLLRRPMWHNEDNNMEQLRVHQLSNSANTERRRCDRCLCIEAAGSVNISIVTGTIITLVRYSRSCSLAGLLAAWPASLSRSCSCTGDTFTAVAGDMVIIWLPSAQTPSNCPVKDNGWNCWNTSRYIIQQFPFKQHKL